MCDSLETLQDRGCIRVGYRVHSWILHQRTMTWKDSESISPFPVPDANDSLAKLSTTPKVMTSSSHFLSSAESRGAEKERENWGPETQIRDECQKIMHLGTRPESERSAEEWRRRSGRGCCRRPRPCRTSWLPRTATRARACATIRYLKLRGFKFGIGRQRVKRGTCFVPKRLKQGLENEQGHIS